MNKLTKEYFANKHNNCNLRNGLYYDSDYISKQDLIELKNNNLVVVYGHSDDLAEFQGAIEDEIGCWDGGRVFTRGKYYINAKWCDGIADWTYDTNIPCATFMILDGEDNYCEALVFSLDDLN